MKVDPETHAAAVKPRWWWLPLVALLAGLLVLPWQRELSQPLGDLLQRLLAPPQAPVGLVIVDIDDNSLQQLRPELGPWPFKRDVFALVVEHLRGAGVRAVVLDVLLADPREGDPALARTLARPGPPVLLAAAGLPPAQPVESPQAALHWTAVIEPSATLGATAAQQGIVTAPLGADGRLRQVQLWHSAAGQRWPAMPLRMWQTLDGSGAASAPPQWPQDAQGRVTLTLPRCADCLPHLSFARLWQAALRGEPDAALAAQLQGQVVVVGSSAVLVDRAMTVHGQVSGAEALALSYTALRDGQWLRTAPIALQALFWLLALAPALWVWWRGPSALSLALRASALLALLMVLTAALLQGVSRIDAAQAAPAAVLAAGAAAIALLQQRWQQRERERLDRARAVAAAANDAKSTLLANVSHEIRTPLNAVLGVAELLAATPLNERQRQHVAVFQQAGELLSDLINDLLDLTKIEAGKLELHAEVFALRPLLVRLVDMLQVRAAQKGLSLTLDLAADLPEAVLADRRRLQQALTNLVGNAIKFTAQGSVQLQVAPAGHGRLRFEVADTGIGIAASKIDSIFDPFVQADSSITRTYGGTGLGLAITRTVVQHMGGSVQVRSTPGLGSVFSIELPLPSATLPPPPTAAPDPGVRHARVLLAEDNEVNTYIFLAMLEGRGLRIDTAANGLTALQMARERRYGVIFMDLQMPGMDGLQATAELRRHEQENGIPRAQVVALTAHSFAEDIQRCMEAGCDHHMAKPISRAQLLDLLERLLPCEPHDPPAAATLPALPDDATSPVLDHSAALAGLGGAAGLHQRVLDHAAVFLASWTQDYDAAASQLVQRRALAHDLRGVASSVGAAALENAAHELEQVLQAAEPAGPGLARAQAAVQDAIAPVVVALTRRPSA